MNKQRVLLLAMVTLSQACDGDLHTGVTLSASQGPGDASGDTMPSDAPPTTGEPAYIIDDMDVLGSWRAVANYAAGQEPLPDAAPIIRPVSVARGASLRAATMHGDALEDGADLFVDFHPLPLDPANFNHVDFSAYTGIAFWARSANAGQIFLVAAKDDQIPIDNEEFWAAETAGQHPWFAIQQTLSDRWQRYEIRFGQLKQGVIAGGPTTRSLHAGALNSIHFVIGVGGKPFDLWIDDLILTCDAGCGDPAADGGVAGAGSSTR
jgi:hypothetical protein